MGKKTKALYNQLLAAITKMQNPDSNPAQKYLTDQAINASKWMQGGDYSQMPKGMFFNFENPAEQMKRYERTTNVSPMGTFALADSGGHGKAMGLANQFLKDKFARDTGLNYQNNIAGAAGNIQGALQQASGYQGQNNQAVIGALQGLYHTMANKPNMGGALLGAIGGLGSAAISKI